MGELAARSSGTTATERYLTKLCERSFLSLWSYPNVFRDQGGGKELCDLLVVFKDTCVIFSDKSCAYPNTGDPQLDWERWYERAIRRSAKQVYGAERWLRDHPDRVFTDAACKHRLPFELTKITKFHRIVVAGGAAQRCREEIGGTGSLMLSVPPADASPPPRFVLGRVDPAKPYVHVFDEVTLDIVLGELDTVSDFLSYLSKKEELIESDRFGGAPGGEADVLGCYLMTSTAHNKHGFPEFDGQLFLGEGFWNYAVTHPAYQAKKVANRRSYWWDHLIERIAVHVREDTLVAPSEPNFQDHEARLRMLASESRFHRRILSDATFQLFQKTRPDETSVRVVPRWNDPKVVYVFALVTPQGHGSYDAYRTFRRWLLTSYCLVTKFLNPEATHIVSLATEPSGNGPGTEDLMMLEDHHWTEAAAERARLLHEKEGFLKSTTRQRFAFREYERSWPRSPNRVERNHRKRERQNARDHRR